MVRFETLKRLDYRIQFSLNTYVELAIASTANLLQDRDVVLTSLFVHVDSPYTERNCPASPFKAAP
jgi:hypothetical protein